VVPGIGTALGAGAGAVVGGTGGAVAGAKAKKAYKASLRSNGNARRVLVAEFAVCVVIAALSPLTDKRQSEAPGAWMKRMTAILGIFFILGLVSAAGRGASKIAAGFGGIVAVTLALSERDLFMKVATIFASTTDKPDTGTGPTGEGAIGEAPESDQGGPVAPRRVGSAPLPPREVSLPPRGA
jgi:lysylphosphatidylglycerol synthetase-like protein (DUF2156 family)